jgi:hypothetical protein
VILKSNSKAHIAPWLSIGSRARSKDEKRKKVNIVHFEKKEKAILNIFYGKYV